MKNIAALCFLFCILLFPGVTNASCLETSFKIKEFAGDWILSSSSVGGVGINAGPGISSGVLRHVTLDKKGNGTENNGTLIFYLADGTLNKYFNVNAELIKLTLSDPANGAGMLTIIDPSAYQGTTTYNFIATRTKEGKVNKLFLILVDELASRLIVTGVLERQQAH